MKTRYFRTVSLILIMACLFVFSSSNLVRAAKYYSMGTGTPAATFYYLGAGFSHLVKKHLPDIRITAESTAASAENINLINRKKIDFGFSAPSIVRTMMENKKLDPKNVAIMAIGHCTVTHWIVRKGSPIKSVYDFKGKRITVGQPGSGTLVNMKNDLKKGWHLEFKDIKPAYLSNPEIITALKEKTIDAGKIAAGVPTPGILDLANTIDIRLLQLEKDAVDRLHAFDPSRVSYVIKKGIYKGVDEDIFTYGSVSGLFCRRDLSEDLVYKIVKVLYEHETERNAIHPSAKEYEPENAILGTDWIRQYVPVHPGVVRYLKEKGLWKN